jgi:hypothetical protein
VGVRLAIAEFAARLVGAGPVDVPAGAIAAASAVVSTPGGEPPSAAVAVRSAISACVNRWRSAVLVASVGGAGTVARFGYCRS